MNTSSLKELIGHGAGNRFLRVVLLMSLSALLFFGVACAKGKEPAQGTSSEPSGARVTQIDDTKVKQLLKPAGKPLLVNFWATWCGPCREEFPDLVRIDGDYRGKIDFFTVSLDFVEELDTGVPKFLTEMKAEMPTYLLTSADENTLIASIAKGWSGALPFTILYDEKGEIVYQRQGKVNPDTLRGEIEKTLREAAKAK